MIDLLALAPHERAAAGLFLGFQYPVEIPGVSFLQFLRESLNAQRASAARNRFRAANSSGWPRRRRRCSAWIWRCSSAR
jgi:Fe-S cluster assembly ATPase SufC